MTWTSPAGEAGEPILGLDAGERAEAGRQEQAGSPGADRDHDEDHLDPLQHRDLEGGRKGDPVPTAATAEALRLTAAQPPRNQNLGPDYE